MKTSPAVILPLLFAVVRAAAANFSSGSPETSLSASTLTRFPNATATTALDSTPTAIPYSVKTPPLDTPWTKKVGILPWPEYPRPQLKRDSWKNLNGIWTYQPGTGDGDADNPPSGSLAQEVLIPSCIESALSGIQELNVTDMWFATTFSVPSPWSNKSVLLNFEAVDYEATVFINGAKAGFHRGGYFRFTIDATHLVKFDEENSLAVFVHDPTDLPPFVNPTGKQSRNPSHIWYRSCSGIWQTVWLESVPTNYVTKLDVAAGMHGTVTATVHSNQTVPVEISVLDDHGKVVGSGHGKSNSEFEFTVDSPKLWSPDSPVLYNLTVKLGDDVVSSYTGFRTISRGVVDGIQRPLLNGKFVFHFGTLDQGFWPDGIYLAPNLEALVFDLKTLKKYGMNMVRKHIKVEPDLFYYACDTIGLMVYQDMPSMPPNYAKPTPEQQAEFGRQLELMINEHKSYTCIVTWIIYNEGWAQLEGPPYPEFGLVDRVRQLDSTRLIDATSGWMDHGAGDFHDNHHYANPQCGTPFYSILSSPQDPSRIAIQGEFGGLGQNTSLEHLWNVQQAIDGINQTYELNADSKSYNYRAHVLFSEFREQVELFACSGGIWTQTTDVEGEVNGLLTYDRRVERADLDQWRSDIRALYDTAAKRGGAEYGKVGKRFGMIGL